MRSWFLFVALWTQACSVEVAWAPAAPVHAVDAGAPEPEPAPKSTAAATASDPPATTAPPVESAPAPDAGAAEAAAETPDASSATPEAAPKAEPAAPVCTRAQALDGACPPGLVRLVGYMCPDDAGAPARCTSIADYQAGGFCCPIE